MTLNCAIIEVPRRTDFYFGARHFDELTAVYSIAILQTRSLSQGFVPLTVRLGNGGRDRERLIMPRVRDNRYVLSPDDIEISYVTKILDMPYRIVKQLILQGTLKGWCTKRTEDVSPKCYTTEKAARKLARAIEKDPNVLPLRIYYELRQIRPERFQSKSSTSIERVDKPNITLARALMVPLFTETSPSGEVEVCRSGYAEPFGAPRKPLDPATRIRILERDGYVCIYCLGVADEVDHILPYSYLHLDDDDNLVASCGLCNRIAGDKIFKSLFDKWRYIMLRRREMELVEPVSKESCVCIDCNQPFQPCVQGSTNFLCSLCAQQ